MDAGEWTGYDRRWIHLRAAMVSLAVAVPVIGLSPNVHCTSIAMISFVAFYLSVGYWDHRYAWRSQERRIKKASTIVLVSLMGALRGAGLEPVLRKADRDMGRLHRVTFDLRGGLHLTLSRIRWSLPDDYCVHVGPDSPSTHMDVESVKSVIDGAMVGLEAPSASKA